MSNRKRTTGWTPALIARRDQEIASYKDALRHLTDSVHQMRDEGFPNEGVASNLTVAFMTSSPDKVTAIAAMAVIALADTTPRSTP